MATENDPADARDLDAQTQQGNHHAAAGESHDQADFPDEETLNPGPEELLQAGPANDVIGPAHGLNPWPDDWPFDPADEPHPEAGDFCFDDDDHEGLAGDGFGESCDAA
ncbi:MAG: hypothetical protein AAF790_02800 [Planctomycetota bacterium]